MCRFTGIAATGRRFVDPSPVFKALKDLQGNPVTIGPQQVAALRGPAPPPPAAVEAGRDPASERASVGLPPGASRPQDRQE